MYTKQIILDVTKAKKVRRLQWGGEVLSIFWKKNLLFLGGEYKSVGLELVDKCSLKLTQTIMIN